MFSIFSSKQSHNNFLYSISLTTTQHFYKTCCRQAEPNIERLTELLTVQIVLLWQKFVRILLSLLKIKSLSSSYYIIANHKFHHILKWQVGLWIYKARRIFGSESYDTTTVFGLKIWILENIVCFTKSKGTMDIIT